MRVLFWSTTLWPVIGGLQVLASRLLPALVERGHELAVITPAERNLEAVEQFGDIPIYRYPFSHCKFEFEHLAKLKQEISCFKREFAPQLVHLYGIGNSIFFHHATRQAHRTSTLLTLHSVWETTLDELAVRTLRDADWVAGCSQSILGYATGKEATVASKSSVIYNALVPSTEQPTPLVFTPPRLLCVGRIVEGKGFDLAVAAFASLAQRFPDLQLVIAGDGRARAALQEQAQDSGLDERIQFAGWVPPEQMAGLINDATIVLMPSRENEAFGLVALQAAQQARPVVASAVGGLPEVVIDGETGLLIPPEDPAALAAAIRRLLEHPETALALGRTAQESVATRFNWQQHVDAYDALYRRLSGP